jgi:putative addiction module component (TIGR02574 family)
VSSATMDVPIDKLRALPLEKRLEIIEALWESVEAELSPEPVSDELADELDREFAAHQADPSSVDPLGTGPRRDAQAAWGIRA